MVLVRELGYGACPVRFNYVEPAWLGALDSGHTPRSSWAEGLILELPEAPEPVVASAAAAAAVVGESSAARVLLFLSPLVLGPTVGLTLGGLSGDAEIGMIAMLVTLGITAAIAILVGTVVPAPGVSFAWAKDLQGARDPRRARLELLRLSSLRAAA
jgi:hypothetical protein